MKKITLTLAVLFTLFTTGRIFAQDRDAVGHRVGPWSMTNHPCFQKISWKLRKSYYSDNADNYTNEIEIKNNYGITVTLSFNFTADANTNTTRYRKTLAPNETYTNTYCPNTNMVYMFVTDVCFNNNCKEGCYAQCDNGVPNQPNCDGAGNTTSNASNSLTQATQPHNDLSAYNQSKAELEQKMHEENNRSQQQANTKQQFNSYYNAGVAAYNKGNYTEAANQFKQALNYATNDSDKKLAQDNYNQATKNTNQQQTLNQVSTSLIDVAKGIDGIIAANRARKEAAQEEKQRIEDERINNIVANKNYYFDITSKNNDLLGQYCDYIVLQFQKAGYTFVDISTPKVSRTTSNYGTELSSKSIYIRFEYNSDTLTFLMGFNFTLGGSETGFQKNCELVSKNKPVKQTVAEAKRVLGSDIKFDSKVFESYGFFELVTGPAAVNAGIANQDFKATNYHGFAAEQEKIRTPNNAENVKAYLKNGFTFYNNINSGDKNDIEQAMFWFQKAVDSGNAVGMRMLGEIYFKKLNYDTAELWYVKAANLGDTLAYGSLGLEYERIGKITNALQWYQKSADLDQAYGYYLMGEYYSDRAQDGIKGAEYYLKGAEKGYFLCVHGLELLYTYGTKNVKKSKSEAKKWHEQACKINPAYCKDDKP